MSARGHKPTKRGTPPPTVKTDFDEAPTEIYESGDHGTAKPADAVFTSDAAFKTEIDPAPAGAVAGAKRGAPGMATMPDRPGALARAAAPSAPEGAQGSQPIRAISMKTPADPNLKPVVKPEREMPHVKLRAMSEMAGLQQPQNLGNLAAPYDPTEARKRTARELVIWGSLVVILASAIAIGVWFVAT
jgi:hypothetical protein